MKRLFVVLILFAGLAGGIKQFSSYTAIKLEEDQLGKQIPAAQEEARQCETVLQELPLSQFQTNSSMVASLLNTDKLSLVQITAQAKDSTGNYSNVVSVDNVDDVAFFTNTIDRMVVTLQYENLEEAYAYISSCSVPFSYIEFNSEDKTIVLYLIPVTIGNSDISNELTAPTDTQNSVSDTQTSSEANETVDGESMSTEYDIQYLGGDE